MLLRSLGAGREAKEGVMLTEGRRWGATALLLAAAAGRPAGAQGPANPPAALLRPPATSYRLVAPPDAPQAAEGLATPGGGYAPATPAPDGPPGDPGCAPDGGAADAGEAGAGEAGAPFRPSLCRRCLYWLQDCFLGYPEEFKAPPLGHWVYAAYKTHVANADAARMVLYRYDFLDGSDVLNPRGKERLAQIAALLPRNFSPVVVEGGCGPALDEARRLAVLGFLGQGPFPVPPERVVVGGPLAVPLSGPEAVLVYRNLIFQTQRQGVQAGLGGGSIGGTVGEGFGAPGRTATTGAGAGAAPPVP
jgi:hypothetical protein